MQRQDKIRVGKTMFLHICFQLKIKLNNSRALMKLENDHDLIKQHMGERVSLLLALVTLFPASLTYQFFHALPRVITDNLFVGWKIPITNAQIVSLHYRVMN